MSDEDLRAAARAYADDPRDDERAERYVRELQRAGAAESELAPSRGRWGVAARGYTAEEILAELDGVAEDYWLFPMLDNAYVFPVACRLRALRDLQRWLVLLEVCDVFNQVDAEEACCVHVSALGAGIGDKDSFQRLTPGRTPFADPAGSPLSIHPECREVLLGGQITSVSHDPAFYAARGVTLEQAPRLFLHELARGLLPARREELLATAEERRSLLERLLLGPPPPELLVLDEWRHPDLARGELPSECESFRLLAEALASGDATRYAPSEPPNTHWSHWPEGGTG